jgi:hypothetical protein
VARFREGSLAHDSEPADWREPRSCCVGVLLPRHPTCELETDWLGETEDVLVSDGVLDPVIEELGVCSAGGQRGAGPMTVQAAQNPARTRTAPLGAEHPLTCDADKLPLEEIEPDAVSDAELLAVPVAVALKLGLCDAGQSEKSGSSKQKLTPWSAIAPADSPPLLDVVADNGRQHSSPATIALQPQQPTASTYHAAGG